jgi:hypothetical protein
MNDILRKNLLKFDTIRFDDVCVYNLTLEEQLEHPRLVLQRFKEHGLKLRLKECFLAFKRWITWATLCRTARFQSRPRKSNQIGHGLRRRKKLTIL